MKTVKVAIIDSGIQKERKEFKSINIESVTLKNLKEEDTIGHGTAIAFLIKKLIKNVTIISFKIFDKDYITNEEDLIWALENIYNNYNIDLVHISSGITYIQKKTELQQICDKLLIKGCIIISAFDNAGSISYPAALPNVIGVYWDSLCNNVEEYIYVKNSMINILGFGGKQRLPWLYDSFKSVSGSSFAAPYITGIVGNLLLSGVNGFTNIMKCLEIGAINVIDFPKNASLGKQKMQVETVKNIEKAIIFPFNKEIQAILGNIDLLHFEITGVFDVEQFGRIGRKVKEMSYGSNIIDTELCSYKDINWESGFDTVILGHSTMLKKLLGIDFIDYFIEKCILYHKNIYCFDSLQNYKEKIKILHKNRNFAVYFHVENKSVIISEFGSLHKFSCPVICVAGTSPKQGKFNLQLELRRRFLEKGYQIGQLGTEPSAWLFGMEKMYHCGFGTNLDLVQEKEIYYLNKELEEITNNEIIIIGLQSQTIPYGRGNLRFYPYSQHNILLAAEPDAILFCINPSDEMDYIKRTIQYLYSYHQTLVIAFVLYPYYKNLEWNVDVDNSCRISVEEEKNIKQKLEEAFGIPVYMNGDNNDMKKLFLECIHYFEKME